MTQRNATALSGLLSLALAGFALAPPAAAETATGVVINNISLNTALNADPTSPAQADDSTVRSGDRIFLGASGDPAKLSGWLVLQDGSRKAFAPGDYSLVTTGDHEYRVTFPGSSLTFAVSKSASVPSVFMSTSHGLGAIGKTKATADKGGTMSMVDPNGAARYSGKLSEIKGRGNTTWLYPKKPYQIKLDKSTELISGAGKSKTWILLANYLDNSNLRNALTSKVESGVLQRAGATDNSIKTQLTDLFVDGSYQGTYLLTEKVEVDDTRVDISDLEKANEDANPGVDLGGARSVRVGQDARFPGIQEAQYSDFANAPSDYRTSGYMFEMDFASRSREERSYFVTRRGATLTVKAPEDVNAAEMSFASGRVQDFEDALYSPTGVNSKGKKWQDYVDVDSFARFYALEELFGNQDAFQSSTFFTLDKGGKFVAGPLWDQDRTLGAITPGTSTAATSGFFVGKTSRVMPRWIKQLLAQPEFRQRVSTIYSTQVGPEVDAALNSTLPSFAAQARHTSRLNKLRWGSASTKSWALYGATPEEDTTRLRTFFASRHAWMRSSVASSGFRSNASLPDGIYRLTNGKLVVDISAKSKADGANAQLWSATGQANQLFRITRGSDGYYSIVDANSGKGLDVARAIEADGQNVAQWTPNPGRNQRWMINSFDGTSFTIASAMGVPSPADITGQPIGWVLTASGNGTKNGTNLVIRRDTGAPGQRFGFQRQSGAGTGTAPQVGKSYTVSVAGQRQQVLDVAGASDRNGANVQLWTRTGGKNQRLTVTAGPAGTFILRTGFGKALDVAGNGRTNGTNVHQWAQHGQSNQQWILKPTGDADGSFFIISKLSGLYLNAKGSQTKNGTNIWTFANYGGAAYKFVFTPA